MLCIDSNFVSLRQQRQTFLNNNQVLFNITYSKLDYTIQYQFEELKKDKNNKRYAELS